MCSGRQRASFRCRVDRSKISPRKLSQLPQRGLRLQPSQLPGALPVGREAAALPDSLRNDAKICGSGPVRGTRDDPRKCAEDDANESSCAFCEYRRRGCGHRDRGVSDNWQAEVFSDCGRPWATARLPDDRAFPWCVSPKYSSRGQSTTATTCIDTIRTELHGSYDACATH